MTSNPRSALLEKVIAHFAAHGVGDTSLRALATDVGTRSYRDGAARWVDSSVDGLVHMGVPRERAEGLAPMGIAVVRGALWELAITGDREGADRTVRSFLDLVWSSA